MKFIFVVSSILFGLVVNMVVLYWFVLDTNKRVATLERAVVTVSSQQGTPKQQETRDSSLAEPTPSRIVSSNTCANCESDIKQLKTDVSTLETIVSGITASWPNTAQSSAPITSVIKEVTVTFGSYDTISKVYVDAPGLNAYIDTGNYPPIAKAQFEATMRIPTANGQVYAQVFDKTDGHPVWGSELISETDTAYIKQSGNLSLPSGNKLYQVQVKSTLGYQAFVESARIKLYFK